MTELPIVDAHQHFWDLERNYLPWLCDEPPIPFRYGDYRALGGTTCRRTTCATPHGTRWSRRSMSRPSGTRSDPVGETPLAAGDHRRDRLPARDRGRRPARRSRGRGGARGHAAFPQVRGIRHKPRPRPVADRRWKETRPARWATRPGGAASPCSTLPRPVVRPADALVAPGRGGGARPRLPGHADHPEPYRPAGGPQRRRPRRLAPGDGDARRRAQRRAQDLGPRPARTPLDRRGEPADRARRDRIFGVERCMFASNFPVDGLCADVRHHLHRLQDDRRRASPPPSSAACSTTTRSGSTVSREPRRRSAA